MNVSELIKQFQKYQTETGSNSFRKILERIQLLLKEIEEKNISEKKKSEIQNEIESHLGNVRTEQETKNGFKNLKKLLNTRFGFVPPNYFITIGIGAGIAIGAGIGISFGVLFDNGIIYGPVIGSSIGLISGIFIGKLLDKKKEDENRILIHL